ncbi:MAG: LysR family transcriptional regulator [Moraxellaceae bacterium]|nr:LysR family transcriptional regulator [Moraxellaceae bacterium]
MSIPLDANDLLLFARVADTGSFSRAAEQLDLPKSTVSRRIAALEAQLGERLLTRSTRYLALTEFGQGVAGHARRLAEEADAAAAFAQARQETPRGLLKVSLPPFADHDLARFLRQFMADYPLIQLQLDISARRVDLIAEQFDIAIRVARSLPDDATLVARRLRDDNSGIYASPAYLAEHGMPDTPESLLEHTAIRLSSNGETPAWVLTKGKETWNGLPEGTLSCNAMGLIGEMAVAGLGLANLPEHFAAPLQRSGQLVRVLPAWCSHMSSVWAVIPSRRHVPSRTRAFIEAVEQHLLPLCSELPETTSAPLPTQRKK